MAGKQFRLVETERENQFKILNGDEEVYDSTDKHLYDIESILNFCRALGINIKREAINIEEFFETMGWQVEFVFEKEGVGSIYVHDGKNHQWYKAIDLEEEIDYLIKLDVKDFPGALKVADQFERIAQKIRTAVES